MTGDATARPTLIVQCDDAGDVYFSWRWSSPEPTGAQAAVVSRAALAPLLDELSLALPGSLPGESEERMVERVLLRGAFATLEAEHDLSRRLGEVILPQELARQLVDRVNRLGTIRMRILAAPSCAHVPWELLTIAGRRLLELADITAEPPPAMYATRERQPEPWTTPLSEGHVAYVLDPETFVEDGVLDARQRERFAAARRRPVPGNPGPGGVLDRRLLSTILRATPRPARLFFLGHVANASEEPAATSMLISDRARTYGLARPLTRGDSANRPFAAIDLMAGTLGRVLESASRTFRPAGQESTIWPIDGDDPVTGAVIWPMPPRVALVACNSGGDLAHAEPFGLVLAMLGSGAGLVTATRWTLPTDFAFRSILGGDPQPLLEMALAIDGSHDQQDPARVLAAWQRERLAEWEDPAKPSVARSPIIWASLTTYLAPRTMPVDLRPNERLDT